MQTSMQKLITQIKEEMTIDTIPKEWYYCLKSVIMSIEATYLEIEKQQIMDAFDEGQEYEYQYHINNAPKFYSETYFAETYGIKGSDETLKEYHIVDTNEMVCYTKQDVIDAIIKIHEIYSLHGQYNDTLEAKKLRLKGVSWHIQNILESLKKDKI